MHAKFKKVISILIVLITISGLGSIRIYATSMNTSESGLSLIKEFEGCRLVAYKALSTEKYYTIGYGHYGSDVYEGMTITQSQAEEMLRNDLKEYEGYVNTFLNKYGISVTQNQFDALVSFTYNLGNVWVSTSTFQLKTYLINGISNYTDEQITTAFTNWCKSGGKVVQGLVTRRKKEAEYFLQNNIPPLPGEIDGSYTTPVNVTADHKINTYNEYGNVESGHYIASGDDCYIDAVYTNGFVHVEYPTSSGRRWAYAKTSDFNIPKPNLPGESYIHCSVGTNYTPTVLWWEKSDNTTSYDVKIWAGKIWEGDAYKILWGQTNYECRLDLPAGYYEAYVDSTNSDGVTMSANVVQFTVENGEPVDVGDNVYAYIINTNAWKHLTNDSDDVSFRTETGETKQIWKFERQSDNSYKIINCKNGKALDVNGGHSESGTNVQVWERNDSSAQRWFIYGSEGAYYLKPACSDCVLDLNTGEFTEGVNAQIYTYNGSVAQKFSIWKLEKPDLATPTPKGEKYSDDKGNNVKISWDKCENATGYDIRIYDEKGENVLYTYWNVQETSYITNIPAGNYQVGVWSLNNKFNFWSDVNKVSFTVEEAKISKGDINNDSSVNVSDVVMMQKYLTRKQTLTAEQLEYADLNSDGKVNVFDVVYLKRMLFNS